MLVTLTKYIMQIVHNNNIVIEDISFIQKCICAMKLTHIESL